MNRLKEIKRQLENRLSALGVNNSNNNPMLVSKEGIEQLVITSDNVYIIVLDVLEVNKTLIDSRPTVVRKDMYNKENSKYVIQEGFYVIDNMKGTHTVVEQDNIIDILLEEITGSNKPKFKVL